jgi:ribokinase
MKELNMTTIWDVLGIGTAAVDDLLLVERFPEPDSKVNILEALRQGGGQTATAMAAAARQGARAAFCCRLGFDDLSLFTLAELKREGVDCSPCHQDDDGNPYHSIIIVDTQVHTRTILHSGGRVNPPPEVITPDLISKTKVLFVDDNSGAAGIKAAQIAHSMGIPVIADVEPDPPQDVVELLPLIDHLVVGRELAASLSGKESEAEMAAALCGVQRSCCVVTAGEKGCWYSERGEPAVHVPGFQVAVVDTTGCGDVFHGVYAAAIARGESVGEAALLANASAALKATRPGGRLGIPDLKTAEDFLRGK